MSTQKISFGIYSSLFQLTCPCDYPDFENRVHNLINYYFVEYGYIEVDVKYLKKVLKYLQFAGGQFHTLCVTLTFYK